MTLRQSFNASSFSALEAAEMPYGCPPCDLPAGCRSPSRSFPSRSQSGDDYAEFLARKSIVAPPSGLSKIPRLPPALKDWQLAIVEWALRRGRSALFEGTGLGKTLQQLAWARAVADEEQGRVILFTPLAVAQQTVREAEKFGIGGVGYTANGPRYRAIKP